MAEGRDRIRCALFVDFDNIYLGLNENSGYAAARTFATAPRRWLAWIEAGMPEEDEDGTTHGGPRRSILVRRCYVNPESFGKYRPDLMNAGFQVVDCPPLTKRGKTSADIYMAVDILDALHHDTHFDEFIILSGDADFTPVLLRLRAHDRRTVVVTVGPTAGPYIGAADAIVGEEEFLEYGLRLSPGEMESPRAAPPPPARAAAANGAGHGAGNGYAAEDLGAELDRMAETLAEHVSTRGTLEVRNVPALLRGFRAFTSSRDWVGFGSLRALTESLVGRRPELELDPETLDVRLQGSDGGVAHEELAREIMQRVREIVAGASAPVPLAGAAQAIIRAVGPSVLASRWAGAGGFKELLARNPSPELQVLTSAPPAGFILDPARHALPASAGAARTDADAPVAAEEQAFRDRIQQLTGNPQLTSREFAVVFRAISEEVAENGYFLTRTSARVRDRCEQRGENIPRPAISLVLTGIVYSGHRFGARAEADTPLALATVFRDNIAKLASTAGLELEQDERRMLDAWILGGFEEWSPSDGYPSSGHVHGEAGAGAPAEGSPPPPDVPFAPDDEVPSADIAPADEEVEVGSAAMRFGADEDDEG